MAMQMTEFEILMSYRQAKEPKEQVKILAELNSTTIEHINEILKSQGVDGRVLPRPRKKKEKTITSDTPKENVKNTNKTKTKKVKTSINSVDDVTDYIYELLKRKKELSDEIDKINEILKDIAVTCGYGGRTNDENCKM